MDTTVVKAFRLLEVLSNSDQPLGVTALADATGLGKSNVHRLLQTLTELFYVRATGAGSYEATLKMWEMGSQVFSRLRITDIARPHMLSLSELTRETVHLSELDDGEVLYIDKLEGSEPVRAYTKLGGRAPAYCTATGKAMLAYADDVTLARTLEGAERHTPRTIVTLDFFQEEAKQIRQDMCAVNRGEWRADIVGLASPIMDARGDVVAAIGISGPASRLTLKRMESFASQLVDIARQISLAMGYTGARLQA